MFWLCFIANCFVFDSLGWALIILGLFWSIKLPLIYINFKKLQQDLLNDDLAQDAQQAETQRLKNERAAAEARKLAASKGAIDDAMSKIMQKIYSRMNRQACGSAVPVYKISLLPTGELSDKPKLLNSSGIQACDDAASRAILQAQPLPMPDNIELFQTIRDITLTFKPE